MSARIGRLCTLEGVRVEAPCFPALPFLPFPYRDTGLNSVYGMARGGESLGPVRGRNCHYDRYIARGQQSRPVQKR